MAQSLSFFGNRRGSTKSHTYQVNGGQQITKDRVDEVNNPRTNGQMVHRCCLHTLSDAHSYLRPFIGRFWEGAQSPAASLAAFRKANYPILRDAAESNNADFSFSDYGITSFPFGPLVVSNGSLDVPGFSNQRRVYSGGRIDVGCRVQTPDYSTIAEYFASRDIRIGDELVSLWVFSCQEMTRPLVMELSNLVISIPNVPYQDISIGDVFKTSYKIAGEYSSVTFSAGDSVNMSVRTPFSFRQNYNMWGAAIRLRKVCGKVLVRRYNLSLASSFLPLHTFAEAIATYPQGGGNVLDGGPV